MGFPISFLSDYALRKGASTTLVRKICAVIGLWIPAICMIILGVLTTIDKLIIVSILVIALGFNSATTCSTQINYIDLTPNYIAPVSSIGNTMNQFVGLIMPYFINLVIIDPVSTFSCKNLIFK